MPETAPNPELLRSLGRLVRGLSTLFWGLPLALVVCVLEAWTDVFQTFKLDILPPLAVTGWLVFGLWQLGHFQKQERVWIRVLDRAKLLALVNFGLSPFLYWWNRMPAHPFFTAMVAVMAVSGLFFLGCLNLVLYRLSVMLPDEHLREETRSFTALNRLWLLVIMLLGLAVLVILHYPTLLALPGQVIARLETAGPWLLVFVTLPPLAMTMALLWNIKEAILDSIFSPGR